MATKTKQRKSQTRFTTARANRFLKVLADGGSVSKAASAVGISRPTAYMLRERNPEFAKLWDAAKEQAADRLEDFAAHIATEGWLEPVYQGGQLVGYKRRVSISLLATLLRANRPEKFRRSDPDDAPPPAPEASDVELDLVDDSSSGNDEA